MTVVDADRTIQLAVSHPPTWALRRYGEHPVLHATPAPTGDRLHHLFEERCDRLRRTRQDHRLAVEAGTESLTFAQLDALADRTARYLAARGVRAGDRVGLLVDRSVWAYASMLAVLKLGAAYVPFDRQFPIDRIEYMVDDAKVTTILTVAVHAPSLLSIGIQVIALDQARPAIEAEPAGRYRNPGPGRTAAGGDDLCYIIYTSGSTGRPKGVPITHANATNFVRVAAELYGLTTDDRVYQGLTLAFDFAVEEIWVPLVSGATLVPAPDGMTLLGPDLTDFLVARRISALCCVPTLLATVEPDLPGLTFLLVSGEACPDELANRWHAPGRRFLNVYGPTEATVSATWTELTPDGRVTIGGPLPTYSVVILSLDGPPRALPRGQVGEIGIAGPGLAPGYLNRDDKTAAAFVDDFIGIDDNPSGRIYRTGDLGRINAANEVEYLGRIDSQVKIRGYRIELDEIGSSLLEVPGVAQAVVVDRTTPAGITELAAYWTRRPGAGALDPHQLDRWLRDRLPPYMVPTTYTELDELPMLPSNKVDRTRLPEPAARGSKPRPGPEPAPPQSTAPPPADGLEAHLASVVGRVLGLEAVPGDGDWFDDLAATSLLLVHIANELRTEPRFAELAVRDLYEHPSVAALARHLRTVGADAPHGPASAGAVAPAEAATTRSVPGPPALLRPGSIDPGGARRAARQHLVCGALQTAWIVAGLSLALVAVVLAGDWVLAAATIGTAAGRSVVVGPGLSVAAWLLLLGLKWTLVGRWRPGAVPVWSAGYLRRWAARTVIRANPGRLLAGSPLYNVHLRLLGARIGPGVSIWSTTVPVCTDLLTIGANAVVQADTSFTGWSLEGGQLVTGPVSVAACAQVGEGTVLDVGAQVGAYATVAHASCVAAGQRIPAFQTWHGSPAEPAPHGYRFVPDLPDGRRRRRAAYSAWRLAVILAGSTAVALTPWLAHWSAVRLAGATQAWSPASGRSHELAALALVASAAWVTAVIAGAVPVAAASHLGRRLLTPGRPYPLYGFRFVVARTVARVGSSRFYNSLLGDSALILGFLRLIGYELDRTEQTGVNFGLAQQQGNARLCRVGRGTLVSDGLTMMNLEYSATAFTLSTVSVGPGSFLGNDVRVPSRARLGPDCLLATKVLVPVDGTVRSGTGLLGSPPFPIPRTAARTGVDTFAEPDRRRRQLRAKRRSNLASMAGFLAVRWLLAVLTFTTVMSILRWAAPAGLLPLAIASASAVVGLLVVWTTVAVAAEWIGLGFRRLRPRHCSVYDPYYWSHERHWKWGRLAPFALFNGTPLRPLVWRLLGVGIGRRVVDDGCLIPERSLTTIGSGTCLNERTTLQGHSLEDGIFTSDRLSVGIGCTLGVGAFVHYGTRLGDGAVLAADSFLLKGEIIPPAARWEGNPARAMRPRSLG